MSKHQEANKHPYVTGALPPIAGAGPKTRTGQDPGTRLEESPIGKGMGSPVRRRKHKWQLVKTRVVRHEKQPEPMATLQTRWARANGIESKKPKSGAVVPRLVHRR